MDRNNSNHSETYTNGVMYMEVGVNAWTWPIPQDEMDANPLMEQDPI